MKKKIIKRMIICDGLDAECYACSECFQLIDASDKFCPECGKEFGEDFAYSRSDL